MTITNTGRRLALVGLLALVASLMPLSSASAAHLTGVTNLDADNNVDAALQWSNPGGFPDGGLASGARDPQYVLIGRDDVFADNLASGALQGAEGPLLLTDSDSLDADVAAEIERLGVDEAVILGGVNAISEGVEAELNDLVSTVSRLEGETRTETAIAITADSGATTAILARSEGEGTAAFADSLAAGAWAAADDFGVLLTQTAELTETTADFLATGQIDEVIIVGGESAVSTDVEDAVAAIDGVTVSRVAGDNRAGTAVAIAEARGFDSAVVNDGVILSEGFIDDAWADGFPAAATSALEGYPVLLSNGDDLPPETATYFEDTTSNATNLVCGPYATAAACDAAAAIIGTVELALDLTSITVGDDVTGTVGGNVATLTVFGCGFGSEEAPVAVTINEDGTFNLGPLPASEDETCTLTFTAADADGNEVTRTVTVTINQPPVAPTVTDAPELLSVDVVRTTNTEVALRYLFDEEITTTVVNGSFFLYGPDTDTTRTAATSAVRDGNNSSAVIAVFDRDTFDASTIATVAFGAVQDSDGNLSPEGSDSIQGLTFAAGETDAPDLLTVGNVRNVVVNADPALSTFDVDFTFDEDVAAANAGDFYLVTRNGALIGPATAAAPNGTNAEIVEVTFTGTAGLTLTGGTPAQDAAAITSQIARGIAEDGAATDGDGSTNPTQVADVAPNGTTTDPDLVGVQYNLDATTGTPAVAVDQVVYTFDEAITSIAGPGFFGIYFSDGNELTATSVVATGNNRVTATFTDGTINGLVRGAFVEDGAVESVASGNVNHVDEEGRAVTFTAGQVLGPVLTNVIVEDTDSSVDVVTGEEVVTERTVTYVFDKDVDTLNGGDFVVYNEAGERLVVTGTCVLGTANTTDDIENNEVACAAVDNTLVDDDPFDTLGTTVLGGVEYAAVGTDGGNTDNYSNPEGSAVADNQTAQPAPAA